MPTRRRGAGRQHAGSTHPHAMASGNRGTIRPPRDSAHGTASWRASAAKYQAVQAFGAKFPVLREPVPAARIMENAGASSAGTFPSGKRAPRADREGAHRSRLPDPGGGSGPPTRLRAPAARRSQGALRPYGLAHGSTGHRPPAHGQDIHQEQPSTGLTLGVRRGRGGGRPLRGGGVRDLDTNQARSRVESEPEAEVAPGDAAVLYGVRREFADDEGDRARHVRRRMGSPSPPYAGRRSAGRAAHLAVRRRTARRSRGVHGTRLPRRSFLSARLVRPCLSRSVELRHPVTYTIRHVPCSRVVRSPYARQVTQPYFSGRKERK